MPLTARDIMSRSVKTVPPDMSLAELERHLLAERVSGAPVVDAAGRLLGVVSRSDILKQITVGLTLAEHMLSADYYSDISGFSNLGAGDRPEAETTQEEKVVGARLLEGHVSEAMVDNLISVGPDTPVEDVAQQMIERGIHRILVTDSGTLLGLVTSTDIVRLVAFGENAARLSSS